MDITEVTIRRFLAAFLHPATILVPKQNLITVRIDSTQDAVTYDPRQLRTQSRESRLFQEESREMAVGERIRFTRYDKDLGFRSGELGTVSRINADKFIKVKLDSGRAVEVSPEKCKHIDYGYAVEDSKGTRAERVIVTGANLARNSVRCDFPKVDVTLYINSPQQELFVAKEMMSQELAQPAKQQHDFGIGF